MNIVEFCSYYIILVLATCFKYASHFHISSWYYVGGKEEKVHIQWSLTDAK